MVPDLLELIASCWRWRKTYRRLVHIYATHTLVDLGLGEKGKGERGTGEKGKEEREKGERGEGERGKGEREMGEGETGEGKTGYQGRQQSCCSHMTG